MVSTIEIIDADGHIWEDTNGIAKFMPAPYQERRPLTLDRLFPPLDHFHFHTGVAPAGAFRRVGVEGWLECMEFTGVKTAVVYPSAGLSFGKIPYLDWARYVARAYNNWLHEAYLCQSPRFKGMGLLPMQDPEAAAEELVRVVTELGMCGGVLPSTGLKSHLGSKEYWPVYREADRLGCALAIHGAAHGGLGFDTMNVFAPVLAMGHPFGLTINLAGLVFNGVFDKFPNVKFGFLEGGVSWFLLAVERFDRAYETQTPYNLDGDLLVLGGNERVSDHIKKQVQRGRLYVGCEGTEPSLAHACSLVGSGAFVFSSDFPHEVNREMCRHEIEEVLDSDELPEADKQAILHDNARRLYLERAV